MLGVIEAVGQLLVESGDANTDLARYSISGAHGASTHAVMAYLGYDLSHAHPF